jgi:predicted transcriptional regulator
VKAGPALRYARKKAGLSQRDLARKVGMPQSTIGRIEAGLVDPQVGTLSRLIRACGFDLEVAPRLGVGVDRTQIRKCLAVSPAERIARAGVEARVFELLGAARKARRR